MAIVLAQCPRSVFPTPRSFVGISATSKSLKYVKMDEEEAEEEEEDEEEAEEEENEEEEAVESLWEELAMEESSFSNVFLRTGILVAWKP